jgi:four helix bundle protein
MPFRSFRELKVWQAAHELTLACYRLSEEFPKSELYGLVSQMRRSAASVPSNIAEGWGMRSTKEFLRHLSIANGSLEETRYSLELAKDLEYCSSNQQGEFEDMVNRVGAMLAALENALRRKLRAASISRGAVDE